jgi:hypothetical protein
VALGFALLGVARASFAQNECLVKVKGASGDVADKGTLCAEAQNKVCVFQLALCLNQGDAGCTQAPIKKRVKAKGRCGSIGKLRAKPDRDNAVCGASVGVRVKTKKKGKKEGKCTVRVSTKSTGKPKRRDVDTVTLVCKPNPGDCPRTTTTTLPRVAISGPCITPCDCCVLPATDLNRCVSD